MQLCLRPPPSFLSVHKHLYRPLHGQVHDQLHSFLLGMHGCRCLLQLQQDIEADAGCWGSRLMYSQLHSCQLVQALLGATSSLGMLTALQASHSLSRVWCVSGPVHNFCMCFLLE